MSEILKEIKIKLKMSSLDGNNLILDNIDCKILLDYIEKLETFTNFYTNEYFIEKSVVDEHYISRNKLKKIEDDNILKLLED